MLFPITQTEPAEFMWTQLTCHVIAPLILLDSTFTLRTTLSIGHNPGNVFTFIRVLGFPLVSYLAWAGSVWLLRALEAEWVATFAVYVTNAVFFILDAIITTLEWAPPHALVIIGEWLTKPFHVSLYVVSLQILQELRVRYHHVTHVLGASGLHALRKTIINLLNQVFFPVFSTKFMTARQTVTLSASLVKLGVTYAAETLVIRS